MKGSATRPNFYALQSFFIFNTIIFNTATIIFSIILSTGYWYLEKISRVLCQSLLLSCRQRDLREVRARRSQPSDEWDPSRQPQHWRYPGWFHHTAQGPSQVQAETDKAVQEQASQKRSKRVREFWKEKKPCQLSSSPLLHCVPVIPSSLGQGARRLSPAPGCYQLSSLELLLFCSLPTILLPWLGV